MFFPKTMTEIELIVPSKDMLAVTKILSGHGVFHQTDSNYPGVASGSANTWQEKASAYASLERRIQTLMQSLSIEEGQAIASDPGSIVELDQLQHSVEQFEEQARSLSDELNEKRKSLEQLESTLHQLEPVEDVDIDIASLRNPQYIFSTLGTIPPANVDRLRTSLARVPYVFLTLRQDPGKDVVWLAGNKSNSDVLERAARSAYLNPLVLPEDYQGTPAQITTTLRASIESTQKRIQELQDSLGRIAETGSGQLRELLAQAHTSRVLADAIVRFGQLRHTYVITGWVPAEKLQALTQRLRQASREILIEALPTKRFGDNLAVPVALSNNPLLRPFQMLVTTYARPRYGELDPTYLIAFTFPLLFGAMFGDVGQGLVLLVLGWLMAGKKIKALKSMSGLGGLIMICGLSATIFGFLYGSVFGFEEEFLGIKIHPLWMNPIHNILTILMVAIGAGIVMLIIAFLLSILNSILARDWPHLLFGHTGIAGFLLYISFLGLIGTLAVKLLPIPPIVFIVLGIISGLAVMFSEVFINLMEGNRPLIEGGLGTYFIQAPMELFEAVISMLSNSLSFVRVGAFAVAHGGLSSVFFILAALVSPEHGVGYWIMLLIGNIFIVGFEGLIVAIQTMRLHYYEFLGKFFTGGGMRFEPLTLQPAEKEQA
jgi:V/A-type H+-transporting ATPase subunit I